MPRKVISEEVRAQVMAALLAGQSVSEIVSAYKVSERWVFRLKATRATEICTEKGARIDDLLFGYLQAGLKALKAQAEVVSEPEYIRAQPASELAVLHGVVADKQIRLLEAAERAGAFAESRDAGGAGEPGGVR
jgi:hypothetical protein